MKNSTKKVLGLLSFLLMGIFLISVTPNVKAIMAIPEGATIKTADNPDVYIVKYKNGKQFKRLVLNPQVFESYGHLRWEDILTIDQSVMDSFVVSDLVRVDGQTDIYQLVPNGDVGNKHLLVSTDGHDLDLVYTINGVDFGNYVIYSNSEYSKDGLFKIETSIVDHKDSPAIQVTIQGKEGGINLVLSGPNKNTIDEDYVSEDDMLDGAETVWIYLQDYLNSTAIPGLYTLIVMHYDDEIFRKEFDIKGVEPVILNYSLSYKYWDYFGFSIDKLLLTIENKGDIPSYLRGVDIILNDEESIYGFIFDGKILAGETRLLELSPGSAADNFSAGIYEMTLKINGQINGKSNILTTYTTVIEVP